MVQGVTFYKVRVDNAVMRTYCRTSSSSTDARLLVRTFLLRLCLSSVSVATVPVLIRSSLLQYASRPLSYHIPHSCRVHDIFTISPVHMVILFQCIFPGLFSRTLLYLTPDVCLILLLLTCTVVFLSTP